MLNLLSRIQVDSILSPPRRRLFHDFWTVCALLLILSTRKLWLSSGEFPQVPFLAGMLTLPAGLDRLFLAIAFIPLCLMLFLPEESRRWRISCTLFFAGMVLLFLVNQHRFQPWAWQFLLIALASLWFSPRHVAFWWRWLAISLYFFSAFSKFDLAFADELGLLFLKTAAAFLHLDVTAWPIVWRQTAALSFPAWELLAAIFLCFPRTRVLGMTMASIMHAMLLLILGPWGLNHHAGVLIWNFFFICQAGLLFWPCRYQGPSCPLILPQNQSPRKLVTRLPAGLFSIILLLPVLELFGLYDNWPAWGLYASRIERVALWIPRADRAKFPPTLQTHLAEIPDEPEWLRLKLDRWSLDALHAPIYPQARFQIGVSAAVIERFQLRDNFRLLLDSPASRFTTSRSRSEFNTWEELQSRIHTYRLNAQPRLIGFNP